MVGDSLEAIALASAGTAADLSPLYLRRPSRECRVGGRVSLHRRREVSAILILAGAVACMLSGLPAVAGRRASIVITPLIVAGAATGLVGAVLGLVSPTS